MDSEIRIVEADLASADHREAVCAMLNEYAKDPMGRNLPLSDTVQREMIAGLHEHPTSLILLAYYGDQPAGVAICFRGFSTFAGRPLLNVHDLAVAPPYRGRGIGRRLLEESHRVADRLGCCKVTLEVREDNHRAQQLYRSLGYGAPDGDDAPAMLFWAKPIGSDAAG